MRRRLLRVLPRPHPGPACSDEDCCEAVCDVDPFCCLATWDGSCVAAAPFFPALCDVALPAATPPPATASSRAPDPAAATRMLQERLRGLRPLVLRGPLGCDLRRPGLHRLRHPLQRRAPAIRATSLHLTPGLQRSRMLRRGLLHPRPRRLLHQKWDTDCVDSAAARLHRTLRVPRRRRLREVQGHADVRRRRLLQRGLHRRPDLLQRQVGQQLRRPRASTSAVSHSRARDWECPCEGSCFEARPADDPKPGCDDASCCAAVCNVDELCCTVNWDDSASDSRRSTAAADSSAAPSAPEAASKPSRPRSATTPPAAAGVRDRSELLRRTGGIRSASPPRSSVADAAAGSRPPVPASIPTFRPAAATATAASRSATTTPSAAPRSGTAICADAALVRATRRNAATSRPATAARSTSPRAATTSGAAKTSVPTTLRAATPPGTPSASNWPAKAPAVAAAPTGIAATPVRDRAACPTGRPSATTRTAATRSAPTTPSAATSNGIWSVRHGLEQRRLHRTRGRLPRAGLRGPRRRRLLLPQRHPACSDADCCDDVCDPTTLLLRRRLGLVCAQIAAGRLQRPLRTRTSSAAPAIPARATFPMTGRSATTPHAATRSASSSRSAASETGTSSASCSPTPTAEPAPDRVTTGITHPPRPRRNRSAARADDQDREVVVESIAIGPGHEIRDGSAMDRRRGR